VNLGLSYTEKGIHWGLTEERVLRKMCGYEKKVRKNKNIPSLNSYNE
jgi:hypothetical protein